MALDALTKLAPMLALLSWAVVEDLRSRRIPNWLTFSLALSGLVMSLTPWGGARIGDALAGMLIGLALPLMLAAVGGMGMGDVKLLAAMGTWLGPGQILVVMLLTALAGGAIILLQSLWQRKTIALLGNTMMVAVSLINIPQLGTEQVRQTGQACRSVKRTVPYAVPIWIATVLAVLTPAGAILAGR